MFKAVQLVVKQVRTVVPAHTEVICRWAGHSKWANIKHQKAINDSERNKLFNRLTRMLRVAVTEGKDGNPDTNSQLASVIGQCRRANMPQSNITNAIKSAVGSKSDEKIVSYQLRGPGRCAIIVEVATSNPAYFKNQLASVMKKHGCKYESVSQDYIEKGILTASPLAGNNPLEVATEHAIECGVEEVTYDEASKKLRFECSSSATWKAKKGLEQAGYVIDTAIVEHIPSIYAELSEDQIDVIQKFVVKLEAMPEVTNITDNIV